MRDVSAIPSFLQQGGETGRLIAAHDWNATALGAIVNWPQSLRTALALLLRSPVPIVMLWGGDGIMLYNDAYSVFAGARHPRLLGCKVREGWPEVADFNDNVMKIGLGGGTLAYRDQELILYRHGHAEQVWMNLDYSPVIDESGEPAGVIAIVVETTKRVLAERRADFLNRVSEQLRNLADPHVVLAASAELVGCHLGVDRAGFGEVERDDGEVFIVVERDWTAAGARSIVGRHRLSDYAAPFLDEFDAGRPLVFEDLDVDARIAGLPEAQAHEAFGIRAQLLVPLISDGRLSALLFVHGAAPRKWSADEIALLRDVAERTWTALRRARAEEALRKSEESLRLAVEGAGMATWETDLATRRGHWSGTRFDILGYERPADLSGTVEDWLIRVHPEDRTEVEAAVELCFDAGVPFTLEYRIIRADNKEERWLHSYGNRIPPHGDEPPRFVGISFDITAQKRSEQHQTLLIHELNHRVKNTLAIVQAIAQQSFKGEALSAAARRAFEGRLAALSAAHNLLTRQNWEGASIAEVIDEGMAAYRTGGRIQVSGPDLPLTPKAAVSLAMAVHELATNAVKYGALANDQGRVDIAWYVEGDQLRWTWRESGGPPVAAPTRRGFGSRMIERGLAAELRGKVRLDFASEGLVCTLSSPLPAEREE